MPQRQQRIVVAPTAARPAYGDKADNPATPPHGDNYCSQSELKLRYVRFDANVCVETGLWIPRVDIMQRA